MCLRLRPQKKDGTNIAEKLVTVRPSASCRCRIYYFLFHKHAVNQAEGYLINIIIIPTNIFYLFKIVLFGLQFYFFLLNLSASPLQVVLSILDFFKKKLMLIVPRN